MSSGLITDLPYCLDSASLRPVRSRSTPFFIFMPNNLISRRGGELGPVLMVTASALGVAVIAAVALGRLSDHVGRRQVVIGSSAAL